MAKVAKSGWLWGSVAVLAAASFLFVFDAPEEPRPLKDTETSQEIEAAPVAPLDENPTALGREEGSAPETQRIEAAPPEALAVQTPDEAPDILVDTVDDLSATIAPEAAVDGEEDIPERVTAFEQHDAASENAAPPLMAATSENEEAAALDTILPALTLEEPPQGEAPEIGNETSEVPNESAGPLLGESSPPLSLAQVLPPGEAPLPNHVSPSFDLVRVAPDGSALIAGRAAPGANVQVFSGTIPVAEAVASEHGEFVVFLNAPSTTTLDLQIPAAPEGAALIVSQEDVVILPAAPDASDTTPIVVHRTPDAVHIVQPAAPAVPGNVSLDLVSYSDSGAVQLRGRGQPGNLARIYADGQLAGESAIAQGGTWVLEISDIAEGRYVLRVDEITPEGGVASRTESPFQRQFPAAEMPESFSQGAKIIVQPGNTLWLMATEAYGEGDAFMQIFSANKDAIGDPDLIYPGQIFSIPRVEE